MRGRALISFPFAFLYAAFVFDLVGRLLERETLWVAAHYLGLVGVVTGAGAVVYGAGRRRQSLARLSAVGWFALAGWVGGAPEVAPDPVLIGMEGMGAALLLAVEWMAGRAPGSTPGGPDPAGVSGPNFGKGGAR